MLFPDPKPLHFLWYDDETIMGVEVFTNSSVNGHYKRWSLEGAELETLGGRYDTRRGVFGSPVVLLAKQQITVKLRFHLLFFVAERLLLVPACGSMLLPM